MLVITMSETQTNQYRPSAVTPPGTTLADLIDERGIKQAELATRMGMTPKFINELIAGKVSITPTTALAMERALDVPADFWLARDARYQEYKARAEVGAELEAHFDWIKELPFGDMCRFRWVKEQKSKASTVAELLRFFGVSSVSAWRQQYIEQIVATAAYRMSPKDTVRAGAVAAWLRAGELFAARTTCEPFNRQAFLEALNDSRELTLITDPGEFIPRLESLFAKCGVVVAFVRAPKGCPASGAVRWLSPRKALVQLSLRYKTNDTLWFTFFHECGHIALHGKKMLFLEEDKITTVEEEEANRFAADRLISPADWANFDPFAITEAVIRQFAGQVGIAPGIVLGRLQKEERVPWSRLHNLKVRYVWKDSES
jgi:HTH-type transcriptional regulator / antitoxin HigA